MIKPKQDKNVADHIGLIYVETEFELSGPNYSSVFVIKMR